MQDRHRNCLEYSAMGPLHVSAVATLLGIIETDASHMWYTFHPQGKNWSHANSTEGIEEALLAFETGIENYIENHIGKTLK